jgi:hypothetical protein
MCLNLGTVVIDARFRSALLFVVFLLAAQGAVAQKDVVGDISVAPGPEVPQAVLTLLHEHCSICHVELRQKPSLLLNSRRWLASSHGRFAMEQRVMTPPPHGMPPGNPLSSADRGVLEQWFDVMRARR